MGILYIIATPIGNLEDITIRAIKTLLLVDYIACEDTRVTSLLLSQLKEKYTSLIYSNEVKPKLISYYDEIEFKRIPELIALLGQDKNVALVSDSGTPLISDPGFKLVRECTKRNIRVISIPGATSFVTALTVSGLPPNNFLFFGYLPPKQTKRKKILAELYRCFDTSIQIKPTIIFFEAAPRLKESLEDIIDIFGDKEIVICRELTKIYEEVIRGKISEILTGIDKIKGELVILF